MMEMGSLQRCEGFVGIAADPDQLPIQRSLLRKLRSSSALVTDTICDQYQ